MNPSHSMNMQRQIMENSKNVNEYFSELFKWEKEINQRDKILENQSKKNPVKPYKEKEIPDNKSNKTENQEKEKEKEQDKKKQNKKNKKDFENLKRDTNNMKDYYKEWDKFVNTKSDSSDSEEEKPSNKPKGI